MNALYFPVGPAEEPCVLEAMDTAAASFAR